MRTRLGGPRITVDASLASASRQVQRGIVVGCVRRRPRSRSDLAIRSGMSSSAISRLVQELLADGWLVETGIESISVGRPRTILSLNVHSGHLVLVLLKLGQIHVSVVDAAGNLLNEEIHELDYPLRVDDLIRHLEQAISNASPNSPIIAVGVSAPGVVSTAGDVSAAPDLGWKTRVQLGQQLGKHFNALTTVDNDVNLMMLAEAVSGIAGDVSNAVFMYHGARGIGLGIMADGTILRGAHGASGEIGLIPVNLVDESDSPALLEDRFSLHALQQTLSDTAERPGTYTPSLACTGGVELDHQHLDRLMVVVSRIVGVTSLLLDPELVVIGGGLRSLLEGRTTDLSDPLSGWVACPPRIELSTLGERELLLALQTRCWETLIAKGM